MQAIREIAPHDLAGGRQRTTHVLDVFADRHQRICYVQAHAGQDLWHYVFSDGVWQDALSVALRVCRRLSLERVFSHRRRLRSPFRHRLDFARNRFSACALGPGGRATRAPFCGGGGSDACLREVVTQVGDALHFLHAHSILHGDLKTDNIMIQRRLCPCGGRRFGNGGALTPFHLSDWDVRVSDFGRTQEVQGAPLSACVRVCTHAL